MQAVCIANDRRALAAAVDSLAESAPDLRAIAAAVDGLAESAADLVARADRKPCAHDELATNRGTDDRTTEPSAVDRADAAPDASADDA